MTKGSRIGIRSVGRRELATVRRPIEVARVEERGGVVVDSVEVRHDIAHASW